MTITALLRFQGCSPTSYISVTLSATGVSTNQLPRASARRLKFCNSYLIVLLTWLDVVHDLKTSSAGAGETCTLPIPRIKAA